MIPAHRPALAVVHGLDVVAVGIAQEHAVVTGVVLGPLTRGVQHLRPGRHGRLMDRVYRVPVGRTEGDVQLPGLGAGRGPSQNAAVPSGPARPTTMVSPTGKRIASRIPIEAKVRR